MAFDVQTLADLAKCGDCLSPNQKQNVLLYLLNGILENGAGGGGLHNFLSLTHPDTVPGPPTRGALVVGNATPDWEALLIGPANRILRSDGTDAAWSQLVLTTDVTGILPIANGGTNSSAALNNDRIIVSSGGALVEAAALTNGQLLIGSTGAAPVAASLTAGANISITPGAGSISIAATGVVTQAYSTIQEEGAALPQQSILNFISAALTAADDPGNTRTNVTLTHSALSKVDDTNVTLTLGGSPLTSLLAATSLTLGWTGTLAVARGGTGTGTAFTQGSVIFAGAAGAYTQDNANFFFDNANNRLGLATAVPLYTLHVFGPGSLQYGFAAGALILGADLNATTISVNVRKIGRVNMVSYDGGATNTFLFGGDFQAGGNDIYFGGVAAGSQYAATGIHFFTGATQSTTGGTERMTLDNAGNVGIGIAIPLATLHIVPLTAPALLISPFGAAAGNTGEFRLRELTANGTNYTGFKAADAMAASEIYVLPNAAPSANRFLQAATVAGGVSVLSWAQVSLTADVTGILPVANGGSGTSTAFTAGSVIFAGTSGVYAQDNANLFYDDAANRLTVNQLNVAITTSTTVGGIYFGASRAFHNFGSFNTFAGVDAGNFTMTGQQNVGVGFSALVVNTTGNFNVAIGSQALFSNTTGMDNVALGVGALVFNTTGLQNMAIGTNALRNNVSGFDNTAVGFQALRSTTGSGNSAIGSNALFSNTSGINNSVIGSLALYNNLTGTNSVAIGFQSLFTSTAGLINVAIGTQALLLATGDNNIAIGGFAADNLTTGSNNIIIGYNIDSPTTTNSNTLTLGNLLFGTAIDGTGTTLSSGNIGIGVITPLGKLHVTNSAAATVGCIIKAAPSQSANLTEWQNSSAVVNTSINAAGNINIPTTTATVGIIFQNAVRVFHTFGSLNLFVGMNAGNLTMSGVQNVGIGDSSFRVNTTGVDNMAIGANSLTANTTGNYNTAIGYQSLFSNTIGSENIGIGYTALLASVDGNSNVALGVSALFSNSSGSNNNAFGYRALLLCTGSNNLAMGHLSGGNLTTGSNNIIIGYNINSPTATNSNTLTLGNLLFGAGVDGAGTTLSSGGVGIRVITPTAKLHLCAGTATASTAPLKFNTGTSLTTAEAGAMEFTTDDLFFTITTGAARKRLLMADATAGLTSGKIPIATTNGRLVDLTASAAYTPTNVTTDRSYDADTVLIAELADVVGTMISDLQAKGILG